MTEPVGGARTGTGISGAPSPTPELPDEQRMVDEINDDRRHERFLIRAAIIAAIIVALAISARLIWQ